MDGIKFANYSLKYFHWPRQCNLSRKFNCKARVTTTDTGDIIVTNNEHCHTEIRQHLKKDYKNKLWMNTLKAATSLSYLNNISMAVNGQNDIHINHNNNNNTSNANNHNSINMHNDDHDDDIEHLRSHSAASTPPPDSPNGSWNLKKE